MSSQSDTYEKATAAMQQAQNNAGGCYGAGQALGAGFTPPPKGTSAEEVLEYLLMHYGAALAQLQALRGRVWQLEAVNETHLMRSHERNAVIEKLRNRVEELEGDVEDREERIKAMAPDEQFEVIGVYTASNKGVSREVRRTLSHLAVASFDGKTTITVDLRAKGRKRAGSGSNTP